MDTETNQNDISARNLDDLPTQSPSDTDYGIHTRRIVHVNRRVSALSARIDALEQARAVEPQPLPAPPAPVEPAPVPETPEQTATRLLSDPQMAAGVMLEYARSASHLDRQALYDQIRADERNYHSRSAGLRLLAATIAAGSFGK